MEHQLINPIDLLTPRGFDKAFSKLLNDPTIATQQKAFEILNDIYKSSFKRNRYSNFESYRKARNFRLKPIKSKQ